MRRTAAFAVLAALAAAPALAQAPQAQRLIELERLIEQERGRERGLARETDAQRAAIAELRLRAREAADAAGEAEAQTADIQARLDALDGDAAARQTALDARRGEIASLASALLALSRRPPESLALEPHSPLDAARVGTLAAATVPALEARALALRAELEALARTRQAAAREGERMRAALASLAVERVRLDAAVEARGRALARLAEETREQSDRLGRFAREAQDLREFLGRLDERPAPVRAVRPPPVRPGETAGLAGYRWPARGRVVENWGANQGGGQIARGLTIEPRDGAGVIAPFEGIVAFAGQFRGYGLILILEHSGGYHSILAQMGRIDAVVGQAVTAGEPVGRAGTSERGTPVLYIELRRNGLPIDPSPLLFGAEAGLRR
ncbi:MAG: murein hydrolase activator EnvC family protein [Tagaea sp.]